MKLLALISAALSLADAFIPPFVGLGPAHENQLMPRGKDSAVEVKKGSSRGGPQRDGIPKGRQDWDDDNVAHARRVLDENRHSTRSRGVVYRVFQKPRIGETGFTYDERTNIARIYYGDSCQRTSDHLEYRYAHDPSEEDAIRTPRPDTDEGRKATQDQRTENQRGLPTKKGLVLEEKPAAGVIQHQGEQATVVFDTAESQNKEGIMCKQAYDLVRAKGYDRNDQWRGPGGVMFISNAKKVRKRTPLVGWKIPDWPDPQYFMRDLLRMRAGRQQSPPQSQRSSRHSRQQSRSLTGDFIIRGSSQALQSRKSNFMAKRSGVDAIADTEASTASQTSAANTNSTSDSQSDLLLYLDAWDMVQENATDVLWPFIEDMLYGTNSSLVYMAAWSILSDMLYMPTSIIGPFFHGWTSMDWDEAQWRNDSTISNATLLEMYQINDILLTLYDTAWTNGLAALNASGYLDDLEFLSVAIDAYNASLPTSWTSVDYSEAEFQPYASYFLSYNSTVPSGQVLVPTNTTTGYAVVSGAPLPLASLASNSSSGTAYGNSTISLNSTSGWTIVDWDGAPAGVVA